VHVWRAVIYRYIDRRGRQEDTCAELDEAPRASVLSRVAETVSPQERVEQRRPFRPIRRVAVTGEQYCLGSMGYMPRPTGCWSPPTLMNAMIPKTDIWCGEGDLNPHGIAPASTSS